MWSLTAVLAATATCAAAASPPQQQCRAAVVVCVGADVSLAQATLLALASGGAPPAEVRVVLVDFGEEVPPPTPSPPPPLESSARAVDSRKRTRCACVSVPGGGQGRTDDSGTQKLGCERAGREQVSRLPRRPRRTLTKHQTRIHGRWRRFTRSRADAAAVRGVRAVRPPRRPPRRAPPPAPPLRVGGAGRGRAAGPRQQRGGGRGRP
jgi:hypothetical protein